MSRAPVLGLKRMANNRVAHSTLHEARYFRIFSSSELLFDLLIKPNLRMKNSLSPDVGTVSETIAATAFSADA